MKKRLFVLVVLALAAAPPVLGCAVCYGDADHPMTTGMNLAIYTLLGCIGVVYVGAVRFFLELRRRSRDITVPQPKLRALHGGRS